MKNHKSKHKALKSLIRKESWELEDVKRSYKVAHDNFDRANRQLEESNRLVDELNGVLRSALEGGTSLSVEAIQMGKQYLVQKQNEQLIQQESTARAKQAVDHATHALKQKLLTKKGLEHTLQKRQSEIAKDKDKKALSVIEENWLQQNRGDI